MVEKSSATEQHIFGHETVLLQQAVDSLVWKPKGFYIDGTFGRGGHSRLILEQLDATGRLLAIDKDQQAVDMAKSIDDQRFSVHWGSFAELGDCSRDLNLYQQVSGILLDLGVSSPQLDQADRGFSFNKDGPLDMRMNQSQGMSAADWIATASEKDIANVLFDYGDERFSRRIAKAIVNERQKTPFTRTLRLAETISQAHPKWEKGKHPATKSFQAIRIHINDELKDLQHALSEALESLEIGGRLVVISFHSLEDRIVKRFMKQHVQGDSFPLGVPVRDEQLNKRLKLLVRGGVKPNDLEVTNNPRARSAIMRVAEKLR